MIHPTLNRLIISTRGKNNPRVFTVGHARRAIRGDDRFDAHRSIARYGAELAEHVKLSNGRIARYSGPSYADYLPFDIDRGENGHLLALRDARALAVALHEQFDVRPDQVRYFFSGSKGYHITVPMVLFGDVEASPLMPQILRRLAVAIGETADVELDQLVYRNLGMLRVEATQHGRRPHRWKTELSWSEFSTLESKAVIALAETDEPREPPPFQPHDLEPIDALVELYARCAADAEDYAARPRPEPARKTGAPLDTRAVVDALVPHYTEGQRHPVGLGFAGLAWKSGAAEADAVAVMRAVAERTGSDPDAAEQRVRSTYAAADDGVAIAGHSLLTKHIADEALPALISLIEAEPEPRTPAHWQRFDLASLREWDCQPLRPVVDGVFAHGNLVYNAAESQTGKTLFSLYLSRQLMAGGKLFGRYPVTPVRGLLYLVLEDPGRRIRDRLLDIDHEFPPVEPGRCVFHVAPGFALTDPKMWAWLEHVIRTENRDVAILDTYQKATPGISSFDDEKQSVILHKLSDLTRRMDITLIVNDHVRKTQNGPKKKQAELSLDDIKGTGGKAQNADAVILMQRTTDRRQIKFIATSKDFDQPVRLLLNIAPAGSTEPKFTIAGDLDELGAEARSRGETNREKVFDAMRAGEWEASSELAKRVQMGRTTVANHLKQLAAINRVQDNGADGRWRMYRKAADEVSAATDSNLPLQQKPA